MQTECDDQGRAEDHPQLLWAACLPLVPGASAESVDRWLGELATAGLIVRYVVKGDRFLQVDQWDVYQHPKKPAPSKHPSPSEGEPVENWFPTTGEQVEPGEEGRGGEKERRGEECGAPGGTAPEAPPLDRHPLLNLLGSGKTVAGVDPPPERDELEAWLARHLAEIEAAAAAEVPEEEGRPKRAAKERSIAIMRWRKYLDGDRPWHGISERRERERKAAEWHAQQAEAYERELEETGGHL